MGYSQTIAEAKQKQHKLESDIMKLLHEFESLTGLEIDAIKFGRFKSTSLYNVPVIENVEVVIKL